MLTRYQIESELSLAYLQAVAAKAAFAVDIPHIDHDSIDAVVSAKGLLATDSLKRSPRIEIQLKATVNAQENRSQQFPFSLPLKNYDELRADTVLPRLLVLLVLPKKDTEWLRHEPEMLILQRCAYYMSLKGLPHSANMGHETVYIPARNMLTPDSLHALMVKASKLEDL